MPKRRVTCPGSGRVVPTTATTLSNNPKTTCPSCGTRQGVMHSGKVRKHMAVRSI